MTNVMAGSSGIDDKMNINRLYLFEIQYNIFQNVYNYKQRM